jgi:hypothetical protein
MIILCNKVFGLSMAAWSITLSFAGFDHFGLMYDKEASGMFGLKWAVLGSGSGFGGKEASGMMMFGLKWAVLGSGSGFGGKEAS